VSKLLGRPMSGDEVIVFARGVVDEGKRDDLHEQLVRLRRLADAEPGTLFYQWCVDTTDSTVLWAHEIYADIDALKAHRANVGPFLPALAACFREPPTPHRCSPLALDP
jgi:quinol monooxygenase YgiN